MRQALTALGLLGVAVLLVTCDVGGDGQPVPPLPSDFTPGATVAGWVLGEANQGRADVQTTSTHANGRWTVVMRRPMRPRPRDLNFSVAVADDGKSHAGVDNVRFTADPNTFPDAQTVVARRVANGQIVPDGTVSTGEWPAFNTSSLQGVARNDFPTGQWPAAPSSLTIQSEAAYDDDYVYFLFRWSFPGQRKDDFGPLLQFSGSQWFQRAHRANDTNLNGILDPGEPMNVSAVADDEDRLFVMWPVQDEENAYRDGGPGCAASCHANSSLDPNGFQALHAWLDDDGLSDVWHWRAAATAPARHADDGVLAHGLPSAGLSGGGSGFAADAGAAPFAAKDPVSPVRMFAAPVSAFQPLFATAIDFGPGTLPGYPVIPAIAANSTPYNPANFNATGLPPQEWLGTPPFFMNDWLPAYLQQMPAESRADVETGSSFSGTQWIVEMRRRRVTRDAAGNPRQDDVQFEEDADFRREGFDVLAAAQGLPFSIAITNDGSGHGINETQYVGPLTLARDESQAGPLLASTLVLHDYGAGFAPAAAGDFSDPRETRPALTSGADVGLVLKAGTDGGENLFLVASWNDPQPDASRDEWTWNGFTWEQGGSEDELRILWNGTAQRAPFAQSGCAIYCHGPGGGFGAPQTPHFSTSGPGELADLWVWRSGRTGMLGSADDGSLDWRFFERTPGTSSGAAVHPDAGRAPFTANSQPGRSFPLFMAAADPNANASSLTLNVSGSPDAVPFVDVLGHLPPPPPAGGTGVSFSQTVLPIFQTVCNICHPPLAELNLQSYAGVIAGGQSGPILIPGNPAQSVLIRRLTGQLQPLMPLGGPPLSAAEIQSISDWIAQGALNN